MDTLTPQPDLTATPLADLMEPDDSWLRRAVDRIRDEASSVNADAAVAAFNSNI